MRPSKGHHYRFKMKDDCLRHERRTKKNGIPNGIRTQNDLFSFAIARLGTHHLSCDLHSFLQPIEPATDQVDPIGPENTTLMDPKFIAVKR